MSMNPLAEQGRYDFPSTERPARNTVAPVADNRPRTAAAQDSRKPFQYQPGPLWHSVLYGVVTAGATMGPLLLPAVGYREVMLGITAVALAVMLPLLLMGVLRGLFPRAQRRP